jgi:FtsH-binding integral membrane protein
MSAMVAFWRAEVQQSGKINQAALEYGTYAALCFVVVFLELALLIIVAIARRDYEGVLAAVFEVAAAVGLSLSVLRIRTMKRRIRAWTPSSHKIL